jgi:hypothetical protein
MKLKFIIYTLCIVCFFISFLIVCSAIDRAYILGGSIALIISVILMTIIPDSYWNYIKKLMNKIFGNEKN